MAKEILCLTEHPPAAKSLASDTDAGSAARVGGDADALRAKNSVHYIRRIEAPARKAAEDAIRGRSQKKSCVSRSRFTSAQLNVNG